MVGGLNEALEATPEIQSYCDQVSKQRKKKAFFIVIKCYFFLCSFIKEKLFLPLPLSLLIPARRVRYSKQALDQLEILAFKLQS